MGQKHWKQRTGIVLQSRALVFHLIAATLWQEVETLLCYFGEFIGHLIHGQAAYPTFRLGPVLQIQQVIVIYQAYLQTKTGDAV